MMQQAVHISNQWYGITKTPGSPCSACLSAAAAALQEHIANPSANNLAARVGDFCISTPATQQMPYLLWLAAGWAVVALLQYAAESQGNESVESSNTAQ
jgi:hypothetical protein